MDYTEVLPYQEQEEPDDLQANLLEAARVAQMLHQRGVLRRRTELPPLNLGALIGLARRNPIQAAQLLSNRDQQSERNADDDANYNSLLSTAVSAGREKARFDRGVAERERKQSEDLKEAEKEWDRIGIHFAQEWGATVAENREAQEAKDKAAKALDHLKQVGFKQRDSGSIGLMPSKERPNPKEGIHFVTPWTANPVKVDKDEGRTFANQKLSSSLNEELQRWTKEYNEASQTLRERTAKTLDLLKQTRIGGLQPNAQGTAIVDFRTGKTYPIGRGTKQGTNAVKSFIYQGEGKPLLPK